MARRWCKHTIFRGNVSSGVVFRGNNDILRVGSAALAVVSASVTRVPYVQEVHIFQFSANNVNAV